MKKKTSLSIDDGTLLKIKRAAKLEKRSVSALIEIWLEDRFLKHRRKETTNGAK